MMLHEGDRHFQEFKRQLQSPLDRLDRGEGIELVDEAALRALFDDAEARGWQRYEAQKKRE